MKKTRPRRPQTNGRVDRFHRILLEEWAYIQPWTAETQRTDAYRGFIHFSITTEPTEGSAGQPPPASSKTTSLKNTTSDRIRLRIIFLGTPESATSARNLIDREERLVLLELTPRG